MANSALKTDVDERTKREAAAALGDIGISFSDAFRLLLIRLAGNSRPAQRHLANLGYNVAQGEICNVPENSMVRARIDERTKREAAAALKQIGLTVSDAFRMLLVRVAAEKTLPFEPFKPNAETIAAMKSARRGELVDAGKPDDLLQSLNAGD